jgi:hypothetical protein
MGLIESSLYSYRDSDFEAAGGGTKRIGSHPIAAARFCLQLMGGLSRATHIENYEDLTASEEKRI